MQPPPTATAPTDSAPIAAFEDRNTELEIKVEVVTMTLSTLNVRIAPPQADEHVDVLQIAELLTNVEPVTDNWPEARATAPPFIARLRVKLQLSIYRLVNEALMAPPYASALPQF